MNPELAQRIMQLPEGRELLESIKDMVAKLNSVSDIKLDNPVELSVEVKGRQRAVEIITDDILSPLFTFSGEKQEKMGSEEYSA